MAIAFDAFAAGNVGVTTSHTVSHTCTGSNRILFVSVRFYKASAPPTDPLTSLTYGGVAMTLIARNNPVAGQIDYLYYLINPASGANNIVANYSSMDECAIRAGSYTGAKQSGVPDAYSVGALTSSSLTISLTTIADNCWIAGCFHGDSGNVAIPGTNSTKRNAANNADLWVDTNGVQTPAGSKSMQCTTATFALYGTIASFAPAIAAQVFTETVTHTDTLIKSLQRLVSETTTITANVLKTPIKILSEALSIVQTFIKNTTHILSETVTIIDTLLKQAVRIFSETVTSTVTFLGLKVQFKELTETVNILDLTLGRIIQRIFTEITTITGNIIKLSNRIFTEIVSLTDTIENIRLNIREFIENISILDTLNNLTQRIFSEITTITDTLISSKLFARIFTEVITLTDSIMRQWNKILSEVTTITSEIIIRLNGIVTNLWSKVARTIDEWTKTPRN